MDTDHGLRVGVSGVKVVGATLAANKPNPADTVYTSVYPSEHVAVLADIAIPARCRASHGRGETVGGRTVLTQVPQSQLAVGGAPSTQFVVRRKCTTKICVAFPCMCRDMLSKQAHSTPLPAHVSSRAACGLTTVKLVRSQQCRYTVGDARGEQYTTA